MLDSQQKPDINKWQMISLHNVFEEAVGLFAKRYHPKKQTTAHGIRPVSDIPLPPVYVDCGNTLFDKSGDVPTIRPNFLNFLIALKNGGYDVRLMSHEPLKYIDILRDELVTRNYSHRFFEDEGGMSILRKEVINDSTRGLMLIDNDLFSIPLKIHRRIDPNDPVFVQELEAYRTPQTPIPDSMRADVLWEKSFGRTMGSRTLTFHP